MKRLLSMFMVFMIIFTIPFTVSADLTIDCDFETEGDALGSKITRVESTVGGKGSYVGYLNGNAQNTVTLDSSVSGDITFKFDINLTSVDETTDTSKIPMFRFVTSGGKPYASIYFHKASASDQQITIRATKSANQTLATINPGEWYTFEIIMSTSNKNYKIKIDGTEYGPFTGENGTGTTYNVKQILMPKYDSKKIYGYLDNVYFGPSDSIPSDSTPGGGSTPTPTPIDGKVEFYKADGITPLTQADLTAGSNVVVYAEFAGEEFTQNDEDTLVVAIYKGSELVQYKMSKSRADSSGKQMYDFDIELNSDIDSTCTVKTMLFDDMTSIKPLMPTIDGIPVIDNGSDDDDNSGDTGSGGDDSDDEGGNTGGSGEQPEIPIIPDDPSVDPTSVADIIIDNVDAGFSKAGSGWKTSDSTSGRYGKNYLWTNADESAWAKWTPTIKQSGMYHVYIMYPGGVKRAEKAPLEIAYDGGVDTTKTINQVNYRGMWVRIGTYPFKAGTEGYVKLLANAKNKVEKDSTSTLADAVKFEWANKPLDYSDYEIETTYESASVYVPYDYDDGATCDIWYRENGQSTWKKTVEPIFETRVPRMFRNSIVNLKPNTDYELLVQISKDGEIIKNFQAPFKTRNDNPTIKRTISIKDIYSGSDALTFDGKNYSGTEDGWTKIVGDGKTIIDGGDVVDNALTITNCKYIIFENLIIKGGRKNGVYIDSTNTDVRFINCELYGWGRIGTLADKGQYIDTDGTDINNDAAFKLMSCKNVVIERCYAHDPRGTANHWSIIPGKSTHPKGPNAIYVGSAPGSIVRYNDFIGSDEHRWNDSIEGANNGMYGGSFCRDTDVYGNMLAYGNDDSIELDGGQMNIRFFRNRIEGFYTGMSLTPNVNGPTYVFENLVTNLGDLVGAVKSGVKNGGGSEVYSMGRQFFFNNTFYVDNGEAGIHSLSYPNGGYSYNATTRNNIIITTKSGAWSVRVVGTETLEKPEDDMDLDYDLLCNTAATDKKGVVSCYNSSKQEQHGVYGEPEFVDRLSGNYDLKSGSLGIDQGTVIPNFKETYTGSAPDIGAIEDQQSFLPFRPIDLTASAYQVNLTGTETKTITINGGSSSVNYKLRQNDAFDFLNVTTADGKTEGTIAAGGSVQLKISADPSKIEQTTGKAIFLVRLENGFSIPITVHVTK